MLSLKPLSAFEDNYIWTLSAEDGKGVVVDPGQAGPVLAAMADGLDPIAILLTHHHNDHIGGVDSILEQKDIPVYAPHDARIANASHRLGAGDRVHLPALDLDLAVLSIPGHTNSHIAFHGGGFLFCGDTLFSLGCGRMFEGHAAQMLASLDALAALPGDTLVCCGHEYTVANGRFAMAVEPDNLALEARLTQARQQRSQKLPTLPSRLGDERACNPFLRVDEASVLRTLAARGEPTGDRASVFAALRSWKDGFAA